MFLGIFIGSSLGAGVPLLWGNDDIASPTAAFFSIIGGTIGLLVAVKIAEIINN